MSAIFERILPLNLVANTAIFYFAARLYLLPLIPRVRPRQILIPILLLHSTRHLGLMFLSPGAIYSGMPAQFAYPAAFGDLITAVLALMAMCHQQQWHPRMTTTEGSRSPTSVYYPN